MKDDLKDIILDVLSNKLDKEDVTARLEASHISINAYNAVLIDLLKKMKMSRKHLTRKTLTTRSSPDWGVHSAAKDVGETKVYYWDEIRHTLSLPVTFADKRRMLTEAEIVENAQAFTERLNLRLQSDKKLFWAVEFGCREFIKKELVKISDSDKAEEKP
jgi:hypothetical protein